MIYLFIKIIHTLLYRLNHEYESKLLILLFDSGQNKYFYCQYKHKGGTGDHSKPNETMYNHV